MSPPGATHQQHGFPERCLLASNTKDAIVVVDVVVGIPKDPRTDGGGANDRRHSSSDTCRKGKVARVVGPRDEPTYCSETVRRKQDGEFRMGVSEVDHVFFLFLPDARSATAGRSDGLSLHGRTDTLGCCCHIVRLVLQCNTIENVRLYNTAWGVLVTRERILLCGHPVVGYWASEAPFFRRRSQRSRSHQLQHALVRRSETNCMRMLGTSVQ